MALIEVQEGDLIGIWYNFGAANNTISPDSTYLYVEEVLE